VGLEFTGNTHQSAGSNVANVGNFDAENGLNVNNWNRDNGNDNVFASPLVVSSSADVLSTRLAFCLFLAKCFEVLNSFYCLRLASLLRALTGVLLDRA